MGEPRRIRNLGILAHVDAGKTTLTEDLLFLSGSLRALGSVDKGTSLSDGLEVERKRGISVRASTLSCAWQGVQINLIDTPGHVDFSSEVERALRVLDGAVLVLSAVEGLQAQTEPLWNALAARKIPVLVFINKIDRMGADANAVLGQLRRTLSPDVVLLNQPENEGFAEAGVVPLSAELQRELDEKVAATDEYLLERYLDGKALPPEEVQLALATGTARRALFPVLCGAAKTQTGVRELLDAVVAYLPDAATEEERPLSGVVFRLDHDPKLGRIAGVRLYTGRLKTRDIVENSTAGRSEKITQIKRPACNRYEDTGLLRAGEIGFLCGMPQAQIGDILGDPGPVPDNYQLGEPLLSVQVRPQEEADHTRLAEALQQLASEDPHLRFRWVPEERELHVRIMGVIQTEILTEILADRFGLQAAFSAPTVVYKETPARAAWGEDTYTMPKPCWAIVTFRIEPGPRGSGLRYTSEVATNDIKQKYQHETAAAVPEALKQGIKGWEVTDLAVALAQGSDHVLHSRPGDFIIATHLALMKGLQAADTLLLEPILAFELSAPKEHLGKICADIVHLRGSFAPPEVGEEQFVLRGRFPLATTMDYAARLGALTGGRARLSLRFDHYEECPPGTGTTRPYRGISPLDRAKYILKMRGAITLSLKG
ncbi:MAG: TetM/TetW/TetO/TetS family tetracycline resistance ribosomal protection protein [Candidatus Handelsmanbacteria bacterium]|nr:TetM/TetW/TetO/TetS family tetracycline resistance ribosomal protection protein [Candidatus Handelsmanbacteria bacterium]